MNKIKGKYINITMLDDRELQESNIPILKVDFICDLSRVDFEYSGLEYLTNLCDTVHPYQSAKVEPKQKSSIAFPKVKYCLPIYIQK